MSHAELTNKLNTQHSKIKSLEMKLHRARQKLETEAINLDDTDNTDMLEMFDFAENSGCVEGNDDMKILWRCQKDALACNDARQYRLQFQGLYSNFYLLTIFSLLNATLK